MNPTPPIIGWDIGARTEPAALPIDGTPSEIILLRAHPDPTGATAMRTAVLRIWGLHPTLVVAVTNYLRVRRDKDPSDGPFPPSQITGTVQALPIVRSGNPFQPVLEGSVMPAAQVFLNGGVLSFDGAEFSSAMQGVELLYNVQLAGPSDHDLVATVQVKQKNALGCQDLAKALIDQLQVEQVTGPVVFP